MTRYILDSLRVPSYHLMLAIAYLGEGLAFVFAKRPIDEELAWMCALSMHLHNDPESWNVIEGMDA